MKHPFYLLLAVFVIFFSCNSQKKLPNTDIDVARAFIKDIQENNFKDAEPLILVDDANKQYFDLFEKHFQSKSKEELDQFKNADIIVNEISNVDDSTTIVNYSNSYKKEEKNKVKLVRVNGQWLVDLKYTFSGNL